jgi:hypothetical protein
MRRGRLIRRSGWCFLINVPVGLVTMALIAMILREPEAAATERERAGRERGGFDLVGFALVATVPRIGRVLIAQRRDAADVPITHTFGPNTLVSFKVWTDEVG